MKIYFQAIFYVDKKDSSWLNVKIVDAWGAYTCGKSYEEAIYMAKDCLKCMLDTDNFSHQFTPYETTSKMCEAGDWIELIEIDLPKQTILDKAIFSANVNNYFPSIESKLKNDKIKAKNLKVLEANI